MNCLSSNYLYTLLSVVGEGKPQNKLRLRRSSTSKRIRMPSDKIQGSVQFDKDDANTKPRKQHLVCDPEKCDCAFLEKRTGQNIL
jgi:hypothetical protein